MIAKVRDISVNNARGAGREWVRSPHIRPQCPLASYPIRNQPTDIITSWGFWFDVPSRVLYKLWTMGDVWLWLEAYFNNICSCCIYQELHCSTRGPWFCWYLEWGLKSEVESSQVCIATIQLIQWRSISWTTKIADMYCTEYHSRQLKFQQGTDPLSAVVDY